MGHVCATEIDQATTLSSAFLTSADTSFGAIYLNLLGFILRGILFY